MVSRGETNGIIFYVTETLVEEMLFLSDLTAIAYNALFSTSFTKRQTKSHS